MLALFLTHTHTHKVKCKNFTALEAKKQKKKTQQVGPDTKIKLLQPSEADRGARNKKDGGPTDASVALSALSLNP